jgi:hypothetical protein
MENIFSFLGLTSLQLLEDKQFQQAKDRKKRKEMKHYPFDLSNICSIIAQIFLMNIVVE